MREQCRTCGKNHVDIGACQPRGGYVGTFTVTCVDPKDARIRELEAEVARLREQVTWGCETPDEECWCAGCSTAREYHSHGRWPGKRGVDG